MTNTTRPQVAAHLGKITLTHTDTEPDTRIGGRKGATTWWQDGTTSYVLHFRSGQTHGWTLADETDTVIQTVDSLRLGEHMTPDRVRHSLRDLRRLRGRLEAIEAELILYAREKDADGKRLTFREIAEELDVTHTSVMERHGRMLDGKVSDWRHWLVQDTYRQPLPTRPAGPQTLQEQMDTAPGGCFLAEAIPTSPGGYVITVTDYSGPEPVQMLQVDLTDWDRFRAASAGHRLIEQGFSVLPAAHFEGDRAAGWKPGIDGLTYSAPVFRLPTDAQE